MLYIADYSRIEQVKQQMIDNGSLQAGSAACELATGMVGGLTGSMINSMDYEGSTNSMPQIFSNGHGNVIIKNT